MINEAVFNVVGLVGHIVIFRGRCQRNCTCGMSSIVFLQA